MIDFIKNKIEGKSILILGFGQEGESTYRFLRKHFPEFNLTIADQNPLNTEKINDERTNIITGERYLDAIFEYDIIFKSPGILLSNLPFIDRDKITSQTDIFLQYYSKQVIGITGTKGKSTTSSLIYQIIKLYTNDVVLVGNIGVPPFDMIEDITKSTRIVFELSSHQLEYISKAPKIAILLNLFKEHLDYYKTFEKYQQSKFNIALFQDASDNFIYNADDELIKKYLSANKKELNYFGCSLNKPQLIGCWKEENNIYFSDGINKSMMFDLNNEHFLKGEHNVRNIIAAINACKLAGIPDEKIIEGICTFKGLEHRIEFVGEYNGIIYYNDSIATIPEATIEAVKTLKFVDTLILGGYDRGIDYDNLLEFLLVSAVRNIIFIGDAGKRMMQELANIKNNDKNIFPLISLEEAVKIAKQKTKQTGICLLSPAAASYDMFKNFEERGATYKKLVKEL